MNFGDISGVEVFRVGSWNGERFAPKDLDAMVAAFPDVGYSPPVKLGHTDDPSAPAFGWVANLRREGERLIADFRDVPDELMRQIREKRYNSVSVEIFNDLVRNGKKFARALKAVAVLGAAIPAVSGLKPISESFDFEAEAQRYTYHEAIPMNDEPEQPPQPEQPTPEPEQPPEPAAPNEATARFDQRLAEFKAQLTAKDATIKKLEQESRARDIADKVAKLRIPAYREFFSALYSGSEMEFAEKTLAGDAILDALIAKLNTDSEHLFRELTMASDFRRDDQPLDGESAGMAVDRLAQSYMAESKSDDYLAAVKQVLATHAELAKAYTGVA